MKPVALLAFVGLCSAPVMGAFEVRSVDTTAPNSAIIVAPNLFQSAAGTNMGPSEFSIDSNAGNQNPEFDSYVAIDTGPSFGGAANVKGDGFQANPGDLSLIGNPFANPGQIGGLWFMDPAGARPEIAAIPNALLGNRLAVFLGRFTFRTTTGAAPSGSLTLGASGISVDVVDPGPYINPVVMPDSLLINFTAFNTPVNTGLDGATLESVSFGGPGLMLTTRVFQVGPAPGSSARWEVHDLYIVQVPGPGTAVLGGVAMLMGRRRLR